MSTDSQVAGQDTVAGSQIGDQLTEDQLWQQVQENRASTTAGEDTLNEAGEEDPLAGLPEPTQKLIKEIQAKTAEQEKSLKEANQKLATAHGTIGNLSQKLNESLKDLTRIKPVLDQAESTKKADEATAKAAKEARRTELKEQLSDVPDILEYVDMVVADVKPAAEPDKPAAAKAEESPEEIRAKLTAERELSDRHPRWIETIRSTEFVAWAAKQPDDIKALGASDDIDDADKMLTMFKKHKEDAAKIAKIEADRKERLRRGENIEGAGPAGSKGSDPSTDGLWNKVKRDREKARSSA